MDEDADVEEAVPKRWTSNDREEIDTNNDKLSGGGELLQMGRTW